MDKEVIEKVVQHINQHARKIVPLHDYILILVDGNSSRQVESWLQECEELRILVLRLPTNTTHLLHPCNQSVNKIFRKNVPCMRDELLKMIHLSWANSEFKIKLAVAGYRVLTEGIARKSFRDAGL